MNTPIAKLFDFFIIYKAELFILCKPFTFFVSKFRKLFYFKIFFNDRFLIYLPTDTDNAAAAFVVFGSLTRITFIPLGRSTPRYVRRSRGGFEISPRRIDSPVVSFCGIISFSEIRLHMEKWNRAVVKNMKSIFWVKTMINFYLE